MAGFEIGKGGWRGGSQVRQIGAISERDNERFFVGTPEDPLVLLGQLKDKTGVDEYGLWIKAGASYIAGYRLFEAIVDPAGLGDYSSIQAALDAGKKRLFLRNGVHALTANLTITGDDVAIMGESREGTIIQSGASEGASDYIIDVSGARCTIGNIYKTGTHSSNVYVMDISGNNCVLQNCRIKNAASGFKGIWADTGVGLKIRDCVIEASLHPVYTTQAQSFVLDNYINVAAGNNTGCYLAGDGGAFSRNRYTRSGTGSYGVHIDGTNWSVSDNFLYSSSTAGGLAIYVAGSKNKVFGNRIEGFYDGIKNTADYGVTIENNSIFNIGNNGIDLQGATGAGYGHHLTVNNTIYSCGGNGIALRYGQGHVITGNTIYDAAADGVYVDTSVNCFAATISHNHAFYCNNGFVGLKGTSSHSKCAWIGNQAYQSTARGFNINQDTSNIIGNISNTEGTASSYVSAGGNVQYNI